MPAPHICRKVDKWHHPWLSFWFFSLTLQQHTLSVVTASLSGTVVLRDAPPTSIEAVVMHSIRDNNDTEIAALKSRTGKMQCAKVRSGSNDFDFLVGNWRVLHRRTDPGTNHWVEFNGTSSTHQTLGGTGNVEDNVIELPTGSYRAKAIRAFDPATEQWAIWWIDGRNPHGKLDPPVIGRFESGLGTFYCDDTIGGKPTRVRFTWIFREPDSARWEQAYSPDAGKSWDTNWTMEFSRA